jgi:hypothetical protein
MQTTPHILMIRPVAFGLNQQTAISNAFQNRDAPQKNVQEKALVEFDAFVDKLRVHNVDVTVIEDTLEPHTPDSIFPNNWISFHKEGSIFLYPMQAENRRLERRDDIIDELSTIFDIREVNDLSATENNGEYLEGTGSMVLDRENKISYACLSIRTQRKVLDIFCKETGYTSFTFHAVDENGMAIYHTNVMMCIGDQFVVICLDTIRDVTERELIIKRFEDTGKEIIEISLQQMNHFAGNMLQVLNKKGQSFLVMSGSAHDNLNDSQIAQINKYTEILSSPIPTIEENGGGSARCMMAEIHLAKLN